MRRVIYPVIAAILSGCGHSEPQQPGRPDNPHPGTEQPSQPEPPGPTSDDDDETAALADASVRYVSADITLRYDDCGVIYMCDDAEGCHTLLDITTGGCVEFHAGGIVAGEIVGASLSVNGQEVGIAAAEAVRTADDGTRWIRITDSRRRRSWLVLHRF